MRTDNQDINNWYRGLYQLMSTTVIVRSGQLNTPADVPSLNAADSVSLPRPSSLRKDPPGTWLTGDERPLQETHVCQTYNTHCNCSASRPRLMAAVCWRISPPPSLVTSVREFRMSWGGNWHNRACPHKQSKVKGQHVLVHMAHLTSVLLHVCSWARSSCSGLARSSCSGLQQDKHTSALCVYHLTLWPWHERATVWIHTHRKIYDVKSTAGNSNCGS